MSEQATSEHPSTPRQRLPILSLLATYGLSHFGNTITFIAVPWFVLELTGSATRMGLTVAMGALPMVIAGTFGGVFVDRLGFKRTSILADLMSGLTVGLIPLLHLTVGIEFWQLLVLIFLSALLDSPGYTARMSLFPDLSKLAGIRLERTNSIAATLARLALLLGPPIAGILIAFIGATPVLWVNTATFVLSAFIVSTMIPSERVSTEATESFSVRQYATELREGLSYLRQDRLIFAIITTAAVMNFLEGGIVVTLPVYANEIFGRAVTLGLMFSSFGAGAIVGTVGFGVVGHRVSRRLVFIGGFSLIGAVLWIMALTPSLWVLLLVLGIAGAAAGPINPLVTTIFQERTPQAMRGRVFGLIGATAFVAIAPGRLLAGFLIERFGVPMTLVIVGATYFLGVFWMLVNPALRDMDREGSASPVADSIRGPMEPVSEVQRD